MTDHPNLSTFSNFLGSFRMAKKLWPIVGLDMFVQSAGIFITRISSIVTPYHMNIHSIHRYTVYRLSVYTCCIENKRTSKFGPQPLRKNAWLTSLYIGALFSLSAWLNEITLLSPPSSSRHFFFSLLTVWEMEFVWAMGGRISQEWEGWVALSSSRDAVIVAWSGRGDYLLLGRVGIDLFSGTWKVKFHRNCFLSLDWYLVRKRMNWNDLEAYIRNTTQYFVLTLEKK